MKYAEKAVMLTPKNLYRLLTGRLRLKQSTEIFPQATLQGLTLVPFWRELLQEAVPQDVLEKLFPVDGTHPRMQSSLMNRSNASPMPPLLRRALPLTESLLLQLVENAMGFLKRRMYRPDQFAHSIACFEDICFSQDVFLTPSIYQHLLFLRKQADPASQDSVLMQPFWDGCHLAWLALLSLYGPLMGCDEMTTLRMKEEALPDTLFRTWKRKQWENHRPQILTQYDCAIARTPLPREEYVPLPITPESVSYRLEQGGKLMLCGIGGCGKTELLRQSLRLAGERGIYARIAYVQYEQSLARSFLVCFPGLASKGLEGIVAAVRTLLEKCNEGRTLLVIDSMDTSPEADEDIALLPWYGCDVVITSRLQGMSGFSSIPVPPLQEQSALRLFSMSSQLPEDMCAPDFHSCYLRISGHPLMLKLLGRICCTRGWAMATLNRHLSECQPSRLHANGGDEMQALRETLAALYPTVHLPHPQQMLLRLLCHLRDTAWKPTKLLPFTPDLASSESELADHLMALSDQGWLLYSPEGFALHPVLREALSASSCCCDDFPLLWQSIGRILSDEASPQSQGIALDTLHLLSGMRELNRDSMAVAVRLELSLQVRPVWQFPRNLFGLHSRYLDTHEHTPVDEIDLWIGRMMYAYVSGERAALPSMIEALSQYDPGDLMKTPNYCVMLNLLECAGVYADREAVQALFDRLAPEDQHSADMISYLNFYSGYIRHFDTGPQHALELLTRARELIEELHLQGATVEVANDTRKAHTLADLGRYEETLPLLRRVLRNLEQHGYSTDSQTMTATLNSYTFFLGKAQSVQEALANLEQSVRALEDRGETESIEYLNALRLQCNLMSDLMPFDKAEVAARKLISFIRRNPKYSVQEIAKSLSISGWILAQAGNLSEGMGLLEEALSISRATPSVNDCVIEGRKAEIMQRLGRRKEASRLAAHALETAAKLYPDSMEKVIFAKRIIEENGSGLDS